MRPSSLLKMGTKTLRGSSYSKETREKALREDLDLIKERKA